MIMKSVKIKKKKYVKPRIKFKSEKRQIVVAVSCQKVFGESEYCNGEASV